MPGPRRKKKQQQAGPPPCGRSRTGPPLPRRSGPVGTVRPYPVDLDLVLLWHEDRPAVRSVQSGPAAARTDQRARLREGPRGTARGGLHRRLAELGAEERGVVLPGRDADDATPGSLRNQVAIIEHARRLAARIDLLRAGGLIPLVLGGDCSILVAAGLSLRRTGSLRADPSRRAHRLPASGQLRPVREPGQGGSRRRRGPALACDR